MAKQIRARIKRAYVDEGLYFITAVTQHRRRIFADETEIERLRETMRQVKKKSIPLPCVLLSFYTTIFIS